ncbi:hypothetical protein Leryth_016203, partial [Lithospermum erythrorhizon]
SGDVSVDQRGDERWRSSLEDEKRSCEHDDQFLNRDNYISNSRTNDESSRRMYAAQSMVIENSLGESEEKLASEEFRSRSSHGLTHIPNHNLGGEAAQHYLSSPSAHTQVSMASDTHQYQGMAEHNRGPVLESGGLCEVKDYSNINSQSFNPEINSFCDNSSLLNMNGQQMLNESGHLVVPSNLNEQINRKQSTIEHMPEPSALSSFSVQAPNDQYAPHNNLPIPVSNVQNIPAVHVAESCLGEFKTQLHTSLEPSTMMEIAPSQSLLHPLPGDCPQNVSNSTKSLDQYPVPKNETVYAANDQKARELLSSLSMIDSQLSILHQIGDSKVEGNNVLKENLHETTKELEVNDNVEKCNLSSKIEADNYCSNRADDQGKEGGNNNKDEKVMRLFKNALVEFVKDILKPKWKEGKMSREVHKTVVKKVVDKVTVTIQAEHVPKTQEQVELYLSSNRPKISKLVQAYVERSLKAGS